LCVAPTMLRNLAWGIVLVGCAASSFADGDAATNKNDDIITRDLVAMNNGQQWGRPSSHFSPGKVTRRAAPTAKRTAHGFEIQLGNRSPVSTPAVYKGRVYSSGGFNSREFYAFDATSGQSAWGLDLSDDGPSASACADDVCVFNTESCTVFAVDASSGKMKWSWFLGDPQTSSPTIAKSQIGQSNVATLQAFQGSRIVHTGKENVSTMGDEVVATNSENGAALWSRKLSGSTAAAGGFLGTPPIVAGKHVLVATLHGQILELDPVSGKTQATFEVGGAIRAQPVVQNGWIYVGTDDGRLVAIDSGDRSLTGWAMWGGNAARTGEVDGQ
jgi:outer membrane protein assembly factor BamB